MEIPFSRWYPVIPLRRSRRLFEARPISLDLLERLHVMCDEFKPFPGVRSVIISKDINKVFKGIIANYGKVKGATIFIAFIGDMDDPYVNEKVGYTGEGIILEATTLKLGTCWVGASFKPEIAGALAQLNEKEKVFAVTPVGFASDKVSFEERVMTGFGKTHKRKPLNELASGIDESLWPEWIKKALEAARLAPSAVNRQPWRFHVEPDCVTISVDDMNDTYNISKRLDCGIAMLHIEVASLFYGVKGIWEFLQPPQVARFKVQM